MSGLTLVHRGSGFLSQLSLQSPSQGASMLGPQGFSHHPLCLRVTGCKCSAPPSIHPSSFQWLTLLYTLVVQSLTHV